MRVALLTPRRLIDLSRASLTPRLRLPTSEGLVSKGLLNRTEALAKRQVIAVSSSYPRSFGPLLLRLSVSPSLSQSPRILSATSHTCSQVIARARAFLRETDAWRQVEQSFLTPSEATAEGS